MSPRSESNALSNGGLAHAKSPGQCASAINALSDYPNLSYGKFVAGVRFPSCGLPFCSTVPPVFGMGSKVQMIWIDASRVVFSCWAVVKNKFAGRYWASVQNPRRNMGTNGVASPFPSKNNSIAIAVSSSDPDPTAFRFVNFGPKPTCEILGKSLFRNIGGRNGNHISSLAPFGLLAQRSFLMIQF